MPLEDWEIRLSNSRGVPYYFNIQSKQSSWDRPDEITQEQEKQLPGYENISKIAKSISNNPTQVRASHLLVKHRDSRRPSSWKEENITRSKEEAIGILREYQTQIKDSAEKFGELAAKYSDCSSHSKDGDLGWFKRGQMQKPFEDATYGLEVGKMSDVISTDSGVHLILRTG